MGFPEQLSPSELKPVLRRTYLSLTSLLFDPEYLELKEGVDQDHQPTRYKEKDDFKRQISFGYRSADLVDHTQPPIFIDITLHPKNETPIQQHLMLATDALLARGAGSNAYEIVDPEQSLKVAGGLLRALGVKPIISEGVEG
jgi:hypothetical protein